MWGGVVAPGTAGGGWQRRGGREGGAAGGVTGKVGSTVFRLSFYSQWRGPTTHVRASGNTPKVARAGPESLRLSGTCRLDSSMLSEADSVVCLSFLSVL